MLQFKNTTFNSSKVFDLSLISSILFVILMFSSTSSGFDTESSIINVITEEIEIVMVARIFHPEVRPPKPIVPTTELGFIEEPEYIEPIDYTPDEPYFDSELVPELPINKADYEEVWKISIPPKLELKVAPKYPNLARRLNLEAKVFIEYIVDKNGLPTRFKILSGNVMFNDEAIAALKQFRFAPGIQNGKAVNVKMRQMFKFSLK